MATNNSLNLNSTNPLDLLRGGSSASLTASNGGIVYSSASAMAILAGTATASQVLLSGSSTTPAWSTATYLGTLTASGIVYASAANVMGQIATANSAVLLTSAAGVPSMSATLTNGQLIIGNTGNAPTPGTLTAGAGISVTNGGGTITIAATGAGFTWVDQTSTPVTAATNTGYIVDNGATPVVFTLPAAPALGSTIQIVGFSAGGWQLLPGAGDTIQIGVSNAATSVTSANRYDCIELVYTGSANNLWVMADSVSAGFTIV